MPDCIEQGVTRSDGADRLERPDSTLEPVINRIGATMYRDPALQQCDHHTLLSRLRRRNRRKRAADDRNSRCARRPSPAQAEARVCARVFDPVTRRLVVHAGVLPAYGEAAWRFPRHPTASESRNRTRRRHRRRRTRRRTGCRMRKRAIAPKSVRVGASADEDVDAHRPRLRWRARTDVEDACAPPAGRHAAGHAISRGGSPPIGHRRWATHRRYAHCMRRHRA